MIRIDTAHPPGPLLLMAHTGAVAADRAQWSVDPFAGLLKDGFLYGRGAQDDKSLLAAELSVLVELRRRGTPLGRDVILLGEADEEAGPTGIHWLIQHAWEKSTWSFTFCTMASACCGVTVIPRFSGTMIL